MANLRLEFINLVVLGLLFGVGGQTFNSGCKCANDKDRYREFSKKYEFELSAMCKQCFYFPYVYSTEQNWTERVCVRVTNHAPLNEYRPIGQLNSPIHINAHNAISSVSLNLPLTIKGESHQYWDICKTICPIAHYGNTSSLNNTDQSLLLNFWTASPVIIEYEAVKLYNFTVRTNEPTTVNISASKPAVLQYTLPDEYDSVRVEADSNTTECMVLSVEDIECPFHDTHDTIQQGGRWLTHTKQSSITIKRGEFPSDLYIVLMLNPNDKECQGTYDELDSDNRTKNVTVKVIPEPELSSMVHWMPILVFFFLGLVWGILYCCFCWPGSTTFRDLAEKCLLQVLSYLEPAEDETNVPEHNNGKTYYVVKDMEERKPWSYKSYNYSWYLTVIFVFYSLPAIQFVYKSQQYMVDTGSLDQCYYNFKCANHVELFWGIVISDSASVFSNIGYIILGVIFLIIVVLREWKDENSPMNKKKHRAILLKDLSKEDTEKCLKNMEDEVKTGIPCHYGLYYALGFALIMEGIMSGIYHICPKKANFQFDTTFMYVICTLCIIKMYYGRHAFISPKAHSFWLMVAISVFLPFIGTLNELAFWILFGFWLLWIAVVMLCYIMIPKKIELGCGMAKISSSETNMCGFMRITHLRKKRYVDTSIRSIALSSLFVAVIVALVLARVLLNADSNTILLYFYILSLVCYSMYYVVMKIRLCCCNEMNTPKAMAESLPCPAGFYFLLSSILMLWAVIGYFVPNNTEWTETPAVSRERNVPCYTDYNYYDTHDVWHFMSAFGLFFFFLFLMTVDDDIAKRPTYNIYVF